MSAGAPDGSREFLFSVRSDHRASSPGTRQTSAVESGGPLHLMRGGAPLRGFPTGAHGPPGSPWLPTVRAPLLTFAARAKAVDRVVERSVDNLSRPGKTAAGLWMGHRQRPQGAPAEAGRPATAGSPRGGGKTSDRREPPRRRKDQRPQEAPAEAERPATAGSPRGGGKTSDRREPPRRRKELPPLVKILELLVAILLCSRSPGIRNDLPLDTGIAPKGTPRQREKAGKPVLRAGSWSRRAVL